jgi:nitroimidazol reductase NimA-like FMN-containing flavoprotein (pyridoxamine 5'-phosphate oxidase superfamily)
LRGGFWYNWVNRRGDKIMNKNSILPPDEIDALLRTAVTGALATIDTDGAPYVVPMHFAATSGGVYLHCGGHGEKFGNILRDSRVSFTVWEMEGLTNAENPSPCRTGTSYRSVILRGSAVLVEDMAEKRAALSKFAEKYAPHKDSALMADEDVARTQVFRLYGDITGKRKGTP